MLVDFCIVTELLQFVCLDFSLFLTLYWRKVVLLPADYGFQQILFIPVTCSMRNNHVRQQSSFHTQWYSSTLHYYNFRNCHGIMIDKFYAFIYMYVYILVATFQFILSLSHKMKQNFMAVSVKVATTWWRARAHSRKNLNRGR